ncbi:hypothetical protein [Mesorhizobium sp.]|uniref:hypothetical protein n=1 Tax=Mesorhizobium sp. TaxID=1871066 RepID=UPI0012130F92|nr:hypothetical protein [Mesorhizobium sp.]TIP18761.1 MAG: hypothetical protein E5X66_13435 [Mesorhizobium sp.]TJV83595.1 MAG: hypothetical protein E5X45_10735 [Mesorhizobium sp.]TJW06588.1 MAG: hypothetical protein E5X42_29165 [Mesorhizobium sp.]
MPDRDVLELLQQSALAVRRSRELLERTAKHKTAKVTGFNGKKQPDETSGNAIRVVRKKRPVE